MAKQQVSKVHIESFPDGTARVIVDDVDISSLVTEATVQIERPLATIHITYGCHDQLTFDGPAKIVHVCPKKAR